MTQLQYSDLLALAQQSGFSGIQASIIAAIAMAESGGNTLNYHVNTDGSVDRGVLQMNSYWHSEVTDSCAYDAACSFQQAYRISGQGSNFSPWVTYNTGDYKRFLSGSQNANITTFSNGPSATGSGYAVTSLTDPLAPLRVIVGNVTGSPFWSWLTSPVRLLKMGAGVLLVIVALVLLFVPDSKLGKVATNAIKGKLSAAPNTLD